MPHTVSLLPVVLTHSVPRLSRLSLIRRMRVLPAWISHLTINLLPADFWICHLSDVWWSCQGVSVSAFFRQIPLWLNKVVMQLCLSVVEKGFRGSEGSVNSTNLPSVSWSKVLLTNKVLSVSVFMYAFTMLLVHTFFFHGLIGCC